MSETEADHNARAVVAGILGFVFGGGIIGAMVSKPSQEAHPAPAPVTISSCAPPPCRDEAMSVIDSDGQRIECSSERHTLTFDTVRDRTFAFCTCGGPGARPAASVWLGPVRP